MKVLALLDASGRITDRPSLVRRARVSVNGFVLTVPLTLEGKP